MLQQYRKWDNMYIRTFFMWQSMELLENNEIANK